MAIEHRKEQIDCRAVYVICISSFVVYVLQHVFYSCFFITSLSVHVLYLLAGVPADTSILSVMPHALDEEFNSSHSPPTLVSERTPAGLDLHFSPLFPRVCELLRRDWQLFRLMIFPTRLNAKNVSLVVQLYCLHPFDPQAPSKTIITPIVPLGLRDDT